MVKTITRALAVVAPLAAATALSAAPALASQAPSDPITLVGACDSQVHVKPAAEGIPDGLDQILVQAPRCVVVGAQHLLGGLGDALAVGPAGQ